MQLISMLLCLTLTWTLTTAIHIIFKPKLYIPTYTDRDPLQIIMRKLPEERRKLSIFPKSSKKFVIALESAQVNQNINTSPTRKPLMKKIKFLNKDTDLLKNDIKEPITDSPVTADKPFNINMFEMAHNQEIKVNGEEDKPEIIKEDSSENNEINSIGVEEEIQTELYPINEEVKPKDNKIKKRVLEEESMSLSEDDDEAADLKEFIFLNYENKAKYTNADGLIDTTADSVKRIIRSDNVIEEENLATTLSTNKFTWSDTRLINDLVFKNIHS